MLLTALLLAATASASVVIIPGGNSKPYTGAAALTTDDAFFRASAPNAFFNNTAKLLTSSVSTGTPFSPNLHPSGDSFIRGAIQAWGEHLHLVLRPDEIWFTILVQLNFYMLSHAEAVRPLFVNHTDRETLLVEAPTFPALLTGFSSALQERVNTPWLLDFILPGFSTTTPADNLTASVLMMGLTQAYFKYIGKIVCGLPSVTLLGTQADWAQLLKKLDRLPDFGAEPAEYARRLKPILTRFVASFERPGDDAIRTFWRQIVSGKASGICGDPPALLSGWVTGFYYWNDNGGPYARGGGSGRFASALTLDGVEYPTLDLTTAPVGYARVPLILRDFNGVKEMETYLAAGTLGKEIVQGVPEGYEEAVRRDGGNGTVGAKDGQAVLKPMSGWMVYGPLAHGTAQSSWVEEDELMDVLVGVKKGMDGQTCGLWQAP